MREIVFLEINKTFQEAVTLAKTMGYKTKLLTGILENNSSYYDPSDLESFDQIIKVDTQNIEAMWKIMNKKATAAVMACYDDHVLNAAVLAEKLSLPHANIAALKITQCKDSVRKTLKDSGFQQPKFYVLHEELLSEALFEHPPLAFPLIFKPVHEAGSQGVKLCHNLEDYQKAIQQALQCTKTYSGYLMERRWLLEEYIPGEIYGAQMLWTDKQWKLLGITKEVINPEKTLTLQGIVFPSYFPQDIFNNLADEFIKWANCIGLTMGALDIEFKLLDQKPVLIEINPRLAGARIAKLMELSLNKSVLDYLIKSYTGETLSFGTINHAPNLHFAQMFLFPSRNGIIEKFSMPENLENDSSIIHSHFRKTPFQIELKDSIDDVIAYRISQGSTEQEAIGKARDSFSTVKIHYKHETNENNNNFKVSASLIAKFSAIQQSNSNHAVNSLSNDHLVSYENSSAT